MVTARTSHTAELLRRCASWAVVCALLAGGLRANVPAASVSAANVFAANQERTPGAQSKSPAPNAGDIERARERWKQLTPQQRDELRQRFEHFRHLDEGERERLRGRFERLGDVKRRAIEALPEPVRRELEALAPPQRGEVLREVAAERMSEHVHDVLEMMPPQLKDEYAAASPERRVEMVREFGRTLHERARGELFRLGRELDLPRERVEALERLDPRELGREVLELRRQSIERMVAERGLPPFVSAEQWAQIKDLRGPEFMRRWGALHGRHGPHGGPFDGPFDGPGGPPPGADPRRHGPPGLGEGPDGPRGERAGEPRPNRPDNSARGRRLRELRDSVRPDPSWFVELSKSKPEDRRRVISERVRERALQFLEQAPELIGAEQLERLRSLQGREFHERLHHFLPDLGEPGFLRDQRGRDAPPPPRNGPASGRPGGDGRPGGAGRPAGPPPGGAPRKQPGQRPR